MSDTPSRGIANLATRRVDPKRMLARNRQTEEAPVGEQAEAESSPVVEVVTPPASQPKAPRRSAVASADEDEAGYLALERKETRLREGQIGELTAHARRLNKAKTGPAPRITENTLIRVAIDLLLSRVDELQGTTEADLRRSVGL
ncbi:hypothetical protein [uncultured Microbacterium sp.]|uniref:hypothetical protein n=1 Tax=uncultured Microbacterium sp. TaxID=191216 RepID=UPI000A971AA0|nr:hypothetical protein [uncultured Microbacterium sp.]